MEELKYPVGRLRRIPHPTPEDRKRWIEELESLPSQLRRAVADLNDERLATPYREGGWTVRQLVHHIADSHMHAYIRMRLALTEELPTIKPYDESAWAELEDARTGSIGTSLALVEPLHERMVSLLTSLELGDFRRKVFHPENGEMSIDDLLQVYSWHSRHHLAHVTRLREREGWGTGTEPSESAGADTGRTIRHAVTIRATPEQVYDSLATGEGLDSWFTTGAEADARAGGRITFRWQEWGPDRISGSDGGEVVEADRPHRLVFRWQPGGPSFTTTVGIDITPTPEGAIVRLADGPYPDDAAGTHWMLDCATGWGEALTLLKLHLEHGVRY